jgi:predicted ATPase/class 3 adenylate cyclase
MPEQPGGTVSFLFSDVEGSTRMLHTLGADGYRAVFDRHRRLLRAAFARHGGYEAGSRGDGFFVAFQHAGDAIAAAAAAQRALARSESPLRVRMAVHTGEALLDPPDYVGLEVHRAARLMDAAHGGQVLISEATRAALDGALPDGVALRDLGEHWLRDLGAPEPLHQLVIAELASEFPLPRTQRGPRAPLPAQATRFVGRDAELEQIAALLGRADVRLLTLTGPGGTGKTRLALAAAAHRAGAHPGGVHFVALAGVSDPGLIGTTLASALELPELPGTDPWALVAQFLSRRDALLVLDNLEQLLEGIEPLGALLSACPRLTILATSRIRLRLAAERGFPVSPLTEPEAVQLFVERADAVAGGFEADVHVASICRSVDCLPLGIELAAARADELTSAEIAVRLDERLGLLTEGPRDAPARQRTLRATLDWSFELLRAAEQGALARLAVFRAGFTLDAAEEVCDVSPETLRVLVENNLVRDVGDRFEMLELIREYALERVDGADAVAERHAGYFLALAERAAPALHRAGTDRHWQARLAGERDNVRAALRRLVDRADGPHAHRLAAAMWAYWHDFGPIGEACEWFEQVIPLPAADRLRARTLAFASVAAGFRGEHDRRCAWSEEGLELARRSRDVPATVIAQQMVGSWLIKTGSRDRGVPLIKDALALAREAGDPWLVAITMVSVLSGNAVDDPAVAAGLAEEAAALTGLSAVARSMLAIVVGRVSWRRGDLDEAVALYRESIALGRQVGSDHTRVGVNDLGFLYFERGELPQARALTSEALRMDLNVGSAGNMAVCIANLALISAAEGDVLRAARLRGAIETYRTTVAEVPDADFRDGSYDIQLAEARGPVDETVWADAFEEGRSLSIEEAAALALQAPIPATVG